MTTLCEARILSRRLRDKVRGRTSEKSAIKSVRGRCREVGVTVEVGRTEFHYSDTNGFVADLSRT